MLVYSSTINAYLQRLAQRSRQILAHEMGLEVKRRRFAWSGYWVPFEIVAFEDSTKLGYFDCQTNRIAINKQLLYRAKPQVLDNILRHEWAHFYCHLKFGHREGELAHHGREYRQVCRQFGWGPEVSSAYGNLDLDNERIDAGPEFEKIFHRLQKLLNLSSSQNVHEAELATLKANQILLKYNLQQIERDGGAPYEDRREVFVKRAYWTKRVNATALGLSQILEHFFVGVVLNRTKDNGVYLEVCGDRVSVELADYMAKYLALEFEQLWNRTKRTHRLRGFGQKKSYITGVARGLSAKLQKQSPKGAAPRADGLEEVALVVIKQNIERYKALAYPHLSSTRWAKAANREASDLGFSDGQNLSLRQGVRAPRPGGFLT